MKTSMLLLVLGVGAIGLNATAVANGDEPDGLLRARLRGLNEVPAVISSARGDFRAKVNLHAQTIEYELSYSDLEGAVTQAHIHVGQRSVNGGVSIWLCSNLASPPTPAGTQPCPPSPATVT